MKHFVRILFILLLVFPISVFAQSEDDITIDDITIDDIENAFANLLKNQSVRMEGVGIIEQVISIMGQTVEQTITQELYGELQIENGKIMGAYNQAILSIISQSTFSTEGTANLEMIFVNETLYMRATDTDGIFDNIYPEEWSNAIDVPTLTTLFDVDSLITQMRQALPYPLNEETVIGFEEISIAEDLDLPEGTRAYNINVDAEKVFAYLNYEQLFGAFEQLGVDMEDLMNQMLQTSTFDIVVYISNEQIVRVEAIMTTDAPINFMGQTLQLSQTATTIINYTDFNFPLEITAPEE